MVSKIWPSFKIWWIFGWILRTIKKILYAIMCYYYMVLYFYGINKYFLRHFMEQNIQKH